MFIRRFQNIAHFLDQKLYSVTFEEGGESIQDIQEMPHIILNRNGNPFLSVKKNIEWNQTGNKISSAVREASVSHYNGDQFRGPSLKLFDTTVLRYLREVLVNVLVKRPQLSPKRRQSLGQLHAWSVWISPPQWGQNNWITLYSRIMKLKLYFQTLFHIKKMPQNGKTSKL